MSNSENFLTRCFLCVGAFLTPESGESGASWVRQLRASSNSEREDWRGREEEGDWAAETNGREEAFSNPTPYSYRVSSLDRVSSASGGLQHSYGRL
jgi:hypothetical protein